MRGPLPLALTQVLWVSALSGAGAFAESPSPPPPQPSAQTFTYLQLVDRLTNLRALSELPPPGENTALASSYDRSSRYDPKADRYLNWGANEDGQGVIRREGGKQVMADIHGPGCVWRMWSATPKQGHVAFYLDGATQPSIDLPFIDYFSGHIEPFTRPHLVYRLNGADEPPGFNNYTPVCFASSCKIVADANWGKYYQFTYSTFPAGTKVPTFRMDLSPADAQALTHADEALSRGRTGFAPAPGAKTIEGSSPLGVGQTETLADIAGPGAIAAIEVRLELPKDPEAQRTLMRSVVISATWDGEASPSVWSPLGDFFGYVGGSMPFQSLPVGFDLERGFYSYWYMPFAHSAHLEVKNEGAVAVPLRWKVVHEPLAGDVSRYGRFHAKWHRDAFPSPRPARSIDWTLLTTRGRGRFVGTHLHGWSPGGGWWGEGDDKFFVDGEKFPSSFGTGTEDYFGYAWSSSKRFSRPYHNQLLNQGNAGHFNDNRWHIPDSVPFQSSFEGAVEKYFLNKRPALYAAEVYWYLDPGGSDPYPPLPLSERIGYWHAAPPLRPGPRACVESDGGAAREVPSPDAGAITPASPDGGRQP